MAASRAGCCRFCTSATCELSIILLTFVLSNSVLGGGVRNHAANAYMLHALGITHVVSVGECALIPPEHAPTKHGAFQAGLSTAKPGSLWIEEREGRIKVLDIKGVCDDGIDSLEPQLPPICEWIDEARKAGGKVLVHCRVGVSRSATVVVSLHLWIYLVQCSDNLW